MAAVTRSAVAGVTPASALITRETVFRLTPAMSATWRMVGRVAFMSMTTLSTAATLLHQRALCQAARIPSRDGLRDDPLRGRRAGRHDHAEPAGAAQHDRAPPRPPRPGGGGAG